MSRLGSCSEADVPAVGILRGFMPSTSLAPATGTLFFRALSRLRAEAESKAAPSLMGYGTFRTLEASQAEGAPRRLEGDRWALRAHRALHTGRSEGCPAGHRPRELRAFAPISRFRYRNRLRSKLGFSRPPLFRNETLGLILGLA